MFGNIKPFFVNYGPASATSPGFITTGTQTIAGAKTFTTGPWTFTRDHVDSSAETIASFALDQDTSANFAIVNQSATNAILVPQLRGRATSTRCALEIKGEGTTDSSTTAIVRVNSSISTGTTVTTRPIFDVMNNNSVKVSVSAGGAITPGGVATTVFWTSGAGTPEGAVTAGIGSLYTRTDGGAATTLYVKESGTGNTGWVAK